MTRKSIAAFFGVLFVFILACNFVTQPVRDAQEFAGTAEAFATDAVALASLVPIETLGALPTTISQFGNYFDPQGAPVTEWNGIPIMTQATAGQEFDSSNYSFRFTGTVKEASDFYTNTLPQAGWSSTFSVPGDEQSAILLFQRESSFLTITVTNMNDGSVVVLLTLT